MITVLVASCMYIWEKKKSTFSSREKELRREVTISGRDPIGTHRVFCLLTPESERPERVLSIKTSSAFGYPPSRVFLGDSKDDITGGFIP